MKRIVTQIQRDKKNRINQFLVGIVLIALLLFSTLGYALGGRNEEEKLKKIEYNNIDFIQENSEYWRFNIDNGNFLTKYNPQETEDITFLSDFDLNNYLNKPLYLVGGSQEPNSEIYRNLNVFVLRIQEACISKQNCNGELPVKDCSIDNIIVINEVEEDGLENIYQQENCVFITASLGNQTKYADKFLFEILGV